MKKLALSISLALFLFSLFLTAASADDFSKIYMVSNSTSTIPVSSDFLINGTAPWFYIQFGGSLTPETVVGGSQTLSVWTWDNPSGSDVSYFKNITSTQNGIWGSLDNWGSDQKLGNWTVEITTPLHANSENAGLSGRYTGTTQFKVSNVVPEPASALLYILGGGSLIAGFFRRKKA